MLSHSGLGALTLLALAALLVAGPPARAQLLSPGPLTRAHAALEGIRRCTTCHELGQRGIAPEKCLGCHTPLRDRIAARRGLHATVARDCATCHRDHQGRAFDPVRLDTRTFNHDRTGFRLVGRHVQTGCRSCHTPARVTDPAVRRAVGPAGHLDDTYLGLGRTCEGCHASESPHGSAFAGQGCADCHAPDGWDGARARFNHAATDFPLTGPHARVDCASCHGSTGRFTALDTSCRSCHGDESPHGAQFGTRACDACHAPATWDGAPRFQHARTDFPLTGAHVQTTCASCHPGAGPRRQFEGVAHATCEACHDDAHDDALGDACQTCHTTAGWNRMGGGFEASDFRHEAATGFALVGAHARLDCASCHGDPDRPADGIRMTRTGAPGRAFPAVAHATCTSCHTDPHDGAFEDNPGGAVCASCHAQEAWAPTSFDLARHDAETRFPLTGAHVATPCASCHHAAGARTPDFAPGTTCAECHREDNPHGEEFADASGTTACGTCHQTATWAGGAFEHDATDFPLAGRHNGLACQSCHAREETPDGRVVRRFSGLATACASCHGDDSPHGDQFADRTCAECHDVEAFTVSAFDHARTRFPLDGAHESVACASCHRAETQAGGAPVVRFRPLPTACAGCHTSG